MSPPGRGAGRRRRRSHRGAKRHAHQQPATRRPHAGPHRGNHRRPRRQRRPQQPEQPPELPLVCPTWIFNPTGNAHVAKDRDWFSDDYVPFKTRIHDTRGVWFEAIGVGTVILPVLQSDGECGEIVLRNVLHYPDAVCNIVGIRVSEDYEVGCVDCSARVWTIRDGKGRPVAYFEREEGKVFNTLLLSGPPRGARLGSCPFDEKNRKLMLGLHWPESERERFEASRKEEETLNHLSDPERAWLKEHWGNEFKFLAAYELSIYDDEEREEGRAIMRTMMAKEKESRELDEQSHDDSHLIDHYFSDDELEEIELQFGNSKIFLEEQLGFSIYNDEHCREAKRNIREFLEKNGRK